VFAGLSSDQVTIYYPEGAAAWAGVATWGGMPTDSYTPAP